MLVIRSELGDCVNGVWYVRYLGREFTIGILDSVFGCQGDSMLHIG